MLANSGWEVNRKRVQRLMRLMNIAGVTPKRKTSTPSPGHRVFAYLLRNVAITHPDQVWSTEIVYSQMTKPAGLAGRPDRERIADLDVIPGYHDAIDKQFDQLSPLFKCRRVETIPHAFRKRLRRIDQPLNLKYSARFLGK